jgi:DHA2 family multidrug resistance protein
MSATAANAAAPAELPPLTGTSLVLGTIALALATFMNVLDTSIANVSIPAIAGDMGVSPSQGTWVITSFAVSNAIAVPLTGWLTQRFGQVRLFTASVVLFVIASFLCGLANSLQMLIAFRILQGAVAGPMIPLSQTLLLSSYPKARAGTALAFWGMTTLVAPVVGPLLGGWITDQVSWPWIFYINIPIGLGAAAATWALYRERETPTRKLPIDVVGLGLLVLWVGAMQILLDRGRELDWFASTQIIVLALVAVVGFLVFLVWELTDAHPVVDLSLFTRRNFWTGTLAISLGFGAFFGNLVLLPLWLQQFMGYTSTLAGMVLAPVGIFAIFLSPYVGKKIGTTDPRWLSTVAFATFAVVLWMRSWFSTDADFITIMIPTIVQGIAMAFFFIPLVALTLSGLPPERIAAASGLSNFARISAGAFGASLATTLWESRAALHHAQLAEAINPASPGAMAVVAKLQAQGLGLDQAYALINRLVDQQAAMLGANDLFRLSAILYLVLIPVIWLARPVRASAAAGAAAAGGGAH